MSDEGTQPGLADRAVDSITDARRAVDAAITEVANTTAHIRAAIDSPDRAAALVAWLRRSTRAAPLTMLGIAFLLGATVFSRRR